jgi:TPR repeat protein
MPLMWFWCTLIMAYGQALCGTPDTCFEHGVRLMVEGTSSTEAAAHFSMACDGGHASACVNLAALHERGEGVEEDRGRAASLYRQGCAGGLQLACVGLGRLMAHGEGVPQDDVEASQLFEQACTSGQASGCTAWGQMLEGGFGTQLDVAQAFIRYQEGCDGGDPAGCLTLAARRVATRRAEAVQAAFGLWKRACTLEEAEGCAAAGSHLLTTSTKPADRREGRALVARACVLGKRDACR